jgi:adenosylmethionine-8-amino-7-oxononanoate aminotransferase
MSSVSFGFRQFPPADLRGPSASFEGCATISVGIAAEDAGYSSSVRDSLYRFFLERGILLRPLGNVVYVVPPYVTPPDELHRVWDAVSEAIDSV